MSEQTSGVLRLNPQDNVIVALGEMESGIEISSEGLVTKDAIPAGHKIAAQAITAGEAVRKYGQIIGFASQDIPAGGHVHVHNLAIGDFSRDYAAASEAREVDFIAPGEAATFQGFLRPDGRAATRNYLGVLATVNCSAGVARLIADAISAEELARYPNLDGVAVLSHGSGCGLPEAGEGMQYLRRAMAGYARHPNFAGVLVVGLGCEKNQIDTLCQHTDLASGPGLHFLNIQDLGGTEATVKRGAEILRELMPQADRARRQSLPASRLVLGLECGGSDAYSGITANPALGAAVDLLVRHGGTAVLSETPEIYGAEHLLTRRARNPEVAETLLRHIRWWEEYTARHGTDLNNNPSPGNKAGGLTTILEKSLGAAAKGGATVLNEVYAYAEPVTEKGLVFMDTPGYDPVSITGLVAGGANVVCFTTGRGSVFGGRPTPVIKLATNSAMHGRMAGDMDLDCGPIVEGKASVQQMGDAIFRLILDTASGRKTKSERFGFGDLEFVPWQLGGGT